MQCEGKEESGEMSSPEVCESMPCGDTARFTVQMVVNVLDTVEAMVTEPPFRHEDASWEGSLFGAPLCPVQTYPPSELVHVDFISIKVTLNLNKPPSIKNVLVLTDHLTRYAIAFITKDQKVKTVACVLYEPFILVFGTPIKLLSDHGMNFMSALVEELCPAFGIQGCGMAACHAPCNGQVERFYQTLFQMIRKLAVDNKAQWEHCLPGPTQAYNSMKSAVTGYLPHYLMLGKWPRLLVNLLFPMVCANTHLRRVLAYVEEVQKCFKEGHTEALHQSNNKEDRQRRNYEKFMSTVQLMLGDVVWRKANSFQGKWKMEYWWDEVEYEIVCQVANGAPSYKTKDLSGNVKTPHHDRLFLVATPKVHPQPCAKASMLMSTWLPILP